MKSFEILKTLFTFKIIKGTDSEKKNSLLKNFLFKVIYCDKGLVLGEDFIDEMVALH